MEKDFCFRCGTKFREDDWVTSERFENYLQIECPNCGNRYSKEKGKTLLESRGIHSFIFPLYFLVTGTGKGKINDERISEIASGYVENHYIKWLKVFIQDVEEELSNPNLKMIDLLDLRVTESEARNYLSKFLLEVKKILSSEIETI